MFPASTDRSMRRSTESGLLSVTRISSPPAPSSGSRGHPMRMKPASSESPYRTMDASRRAAWPLELLANVDAPHPVVVAGSAARPVLEPSHVPPHLESHLQRVVDLRADLDLIELRGRRNLDEVVPSNLHRDEITVSHVGVEEHRSSRDGGVVYIEIDIVRTVFVGFCEAPKAVILLL